MTIFTKAQLEKEISGALAKWMDGAYYCMRVKEYRCDKNCQSDIILEVQMHINGDISDLPAGYVKGDPDSEYVMSLLESKKKMDWKKSDEVYNELKEKGYHVNWKAYYKGKPLTNEISWKMAPCKFTYEIVRVDKFD